MKYLLLLLPIFLYANLTFNSSHSKELAVLESFDIEASFLYDPLMNDMRTKNSSTARNKHFFNAMKNAYVFIPTIKDILNQNSVPQEFLYLAMAESNFNAKAYSNKKAAGLWQFMPATGKHYKLEINEYVDERRDLIKSTKAASKYLSQLHNRFGKWYLAAIAYNCGQGRLNRAIKKAGSDELSVLLDPKKKYIPRESRNYIRKIVALALIGNDHQFMLASEYGYLLNRANAYSLSTVKLPRGESLKRVSSLIDIPLKDLQKLNRHLNYDFVPPYKDDYEVYIPYIKLADFKQKYVKQPMQNIYKIHTVTKGDNLSYIGQRYGVSYKMIMDFNKLKNSSLKLKQKLVIPIDSKGMKRHLSKKFYYTVKRGDSLEAISKAYKVTVKSLKIKNRLKSSLIKIGDKLKIYE